MDMVSGLNWPLWAAFHTVIEIHLLLGGGVRDVMKERRRDGGREGERLKIDIYLKDSGSMSMKRVS